MNIKLLTLSLILMLFMPVVLADTFAPDNLNFRNRYNATNIVYLNASTICFGSDCRIVWPYVNTSFNQSLTDGLYIAKSDESSLNVNSSSFWNGIYDYNTTQFFVQSLKLNIQNTWLNDVILSVASVFNETNKIPTHLSNLTDNLGNRGYTHLTNFTDNLGDRGYTHLSNFTDDVVSGFYLTINDQRYNDTLFIINVNSSLQQEIINRIGNDTLKLNITDQRYNDSSAIALKLDTSTFTSFVTRGNCSAGTALIGFDGVFSYCSAFSVSDTTYTHLSNFTDDVVSGFYLTINDQRYNDTLFIINVNSSLQQEIINRIGNDTLKLNITDQRYNESTQITNLNASLTNNYIKKGTPNAWIIHWNNVTNRVTHLSNLTDNVVSGNYLLINDQRYNETTRLDVINSSLESQKTKQANDNTSITSALAMKLQSNSSAILKNITFLNGSDIPVYTLYSSFTGGTLTGSGFLGSKGGIYTDGDIYTTGTGDNIWLGNATEASALFWAGANGNIRAVDINASGTILEGGSTLNSKYNDSAAIALKLDTSTFTSFVTRGNCSAGTALIGFDGVFNYCSTFAVNNTNTIYTHLSNFTDDVVSGNYLAIGDQRYNETTYITNVNTSLTASKAGIGTCPVGQVVMNTTANGVQCVTVGTGSFSGYINYSNVLNHPVDCAGDNYFQIGSNNETRICAALNEAAITRFNNYIPVGTANAWIISLDNITIGISSAGYQFTGILNITNQINLTGNISRQGGFLEYWNGSCVIRKIGNTQDALCP